jgi:hypothetical protein
VRLVLESQASSCSLSTRPCLPVGESETPDAQAKQHCARMLGGSGTNRRATLHGRLAAARRCSTAATAGGTIIHSPRAFTRKCVGRGYAVTTTDLLTPRFRLRGPSLVGGADAGAQTLIRRGLLPDRAGCEKPPAGLRELSHRTELTKKTREKGLNSPRQAANHPSRSMAESCKIANYNCSSDGVGTTAGAVCPIGNWLFIWRSYV